MNIPTGWYVVTSVFSSSHFRISILLWYLVAALRPLMSSASYQPRSTRQNLASSTKPRDSITTWTSDENIFSAMTTFCLSIIMLLSTWDMFRLEPFVFPSGPRQSRHQFGYLSPVCACDKQETSCRLGYGRVDRCKMRQLQIRYIFRLGKLLTTFTCYSIDVHWNVVMDYGCFFKLTHFTFICHFTVHIV